MKEESLTGKTVKGVFWNTINTYSVQGFQFVIGIILARILTPSDYGLVGMTAIFFAISNVFIDSGFGGALVQKKDRNEDDYATVFYVNFIASLFFFCLFFVISPYVAAFFEQPLLKDLMRVSAISLIINALVGTSRNKLYVAVDFKTTTKVNVISSFISGCVALFCAFSGFGVWTFVVQGLIRSIVSALLFFYFVRWIPRNRFSKASFNRLFSFGSKILVASLISVVYENIYSFIIGKKFSASNLGFYTKSENFASFAGGTPASVLERVAFPVLADMQDDKPRLLAAYSRYIKMVAFFIFPFLMGLCGIAKPFILFLITDKWSSCIVLLQILCFSYLWNAFTRININLLNVIGRSDLVLKLEIVKKSIAFIILFISLYWGIIGMCIGRVVYAIIAYYMNTYYTKKIFNYGFVTQMKEIAPAFFLSLFMMCIALIISDSISTPFLSLLISLLVCPVFYFAASYIFKFSSLFELKEIIKNKIKK